MTTFNSSNKINENLATNETYRNNIEFMITEAIKEGVSASKIADTFEAFGISRENTLTMVCLIGTKLNLEANPHMSWEQAFRIYSGI